MNLRGFFSFSWLGFDGLYKIIGFPFASKKFSVTTPLNFASDPLSPLLQYQLMYIRPIQFIFHILQLFPIFLADCYRLDTFFLYIFQSSYF